MNKTMTKCPLNEKEVEIILLRSAITHDCMKTLCEGYPNSLFEDLAKTVLNIIKQEQKAPRR